MLGEKSFFWRIELKSLILLGTKFYVYLIEIPFIIVLIGALKYNKTSENLLKLYPLIIASALGIILVLLYFFNAVVISRSRIRQFGLFSSRDSAIINKDKTLVLTYLSHRKMRIELFALQVKPSLEWINEENYVPREANVFRERVIGADFTAKRILKFFGLEGNQISDLLLNDEFKIETDEILFLSDIYEERKRIHLKFKKTV
jgi:hypothetical protein